MPGGRPTLRTPEVEDAIVDRLEAGESIASIGRVEGMPTARTISRWIEEDPAFRQRYTRARDAGMDRIADDALSIADGTVGKDSDGINAARLRVDARKWYLSKLAPKKYGDRVTAEISGPDGGAIPVSLVDVVRRAAAAKDQPS